jgi:hypothetical protein
MATFPKTTRVEANAQMAKRKVVEESPRTTNAIPMAVKSTAEIRRSPAILPSISHGPSAKAENEHELFSLLSTTSNKRQSKSELDVIFAMVQEEFSNYKYGIGSKFLIHCVFHIHPSNRRNIDISIPELDEFQKELEEELHQQVNDITRLSFHLVFVY